MDDGLDWTPVEETLTLGRNLVKRLDTVGDLASIDQARAVWRDRFDQLGLDPENERDLLAVLTGLDAFARLTITSNASDSPIAVHALSTLEAHAGALTPWIEEARFG